MSFPPAKSRPNDRAELADALNSFVTMSPTVALPPVGSLGGRPEERSYTTPPYTSPDVADLRGPVVPLRTATEDLWAISNNQGVWQRTNPGESQSDFLVVDPLTPPLTDEPRVATSHPLQMPPSAPPPANSFSNSWSARPGTPYEDPLRPMCMVIHAAIEQHLIEQGESMPFERTPEHIELIRRLTLNYLRHDRTMADAIADAAEAERLIAAVIDETLGFGPLDPLLRDESVSEIMVTGPHMTYVEQGGRLHEVPVHFEDDAHLMRIIQKMLQPLGLTIGPQAPIADGRLPDGSRVNVVIPPSALSGPTLTIRRSIRRAFTLEQLVRMDSLSLHMADFLRLCMSARLNIIICGVGGAGKTTLLNALASSIDEHERIVTIEDATELQLHQRHVVRFEVPLHRAARGITAADLITSVLHMRPERLIIGETGGSEALAILQAMNAGYDGTMTTMYANGPRDVLVRLEALCIGASQSIPMLAVRQQIATGIDLILYCSRLRDGTRRVISVTDVLGIDGESIVTQEMFVFREAGLDMSSGRIRGEFVAMGARPSFASRIEDNQAPGFSPHFFSRGA